MSAYSFIAADYELPELDNTKKRFVTPAEAKELGLTAPTYRAWDEFEQTERILVFESEEDMNELQITANGYTDIETLLRTCLPYIYTLDFMYSEKRALELIDYLKANAKPNCELELWEIWLDDPTPVKPVDCGINELATDHIKALYDRASPAHAYPACLRIHA